jgi:hypothetical protein
MEKIQRNAFSDTEVTIPCTYQLLQSASTSEKKDEVRWDIAVSDHDIQNRFNLFFLCGCETVSGV